MFVLLWTEYSIRLSFFTIFPIFFFHVCCLSDCLHNTFWEWWLYRHFNRPIRSILHFFCAVAPLNCSFKLKFNQSGKCASDAQQQQERKIGKVYMVKYAMESLKWQSHVCVCCLVWKWNVWTSHRHALTTRTIT